MFFKTSCLKADFNVCHQKALVPKVQNVLGIRKEKVNIFSALEAPIVLLGEEIIKIIIIKHL